MKFLLITLAFLTYHSAKADTIFDPQIVFGSKQWQTPKPYIGIGMAFSNINPDAGTKETFQSDFFTGLARFNNLTVHLGIRFNGFLGAEFAYANIAKTIPDNNGSHNFNADLLLFKAMFFPISIDLGPWASAELFLTFGGATFANLGSTYKNNANVTTTDNLNNTFNFVYGGGIQIGFAKSVALRFELNALTPMNGQSFGASPYGNVMLLYNLTVSFYPF